MGAEAVKRVAEGRDVEAVANENAPSIDGNDSRSGSQNGSERIVAHADTAPSDGSVGYERAFLREHMVGGTGVCDDEAGFECAMPCGDESSRVGWWVVEQREDELGKVNSADALWVHEGRRSRAT